MNVNIADKETCVMLSNMKFWILFSRIVGNYLEAISKAIEKLISLQKSIHYYNNKIKFILVIVPSVHYQLSSNIYLLVSFFFSHLNESCIHASLNIQNVKQEIKRHNLIAHWLSAILLLFFLHLFFTISQAFNKFILYAASPLYSLQSVLEFL